MKYMFWKKQEEKKMYEEIPKPKPKAFNVSFTLKGELKEKLEQVMSKKQLNAATIGKIAIQDYIDKELS